MENTRGKKIMRNITDNSDTSENLWKDLLKYGSAIAGAVWATKRVNNSVVNHHRKYNALEEFENQDLFWRDRQRLKTAFKQHDFYVTKFPDTPRDIFPLAVKILYQLIRYHNKSNPDSRLGEEILNECEKLHRIAFKKNFSPINREWSYWKLIQQEVPKKNFWGKIIFIKQFFTNSFWNLEDFLNDFEGGIIRFGLFGVQDKRIDVCFYEKKSFGKLGKGVELDESETDKTLQLVWDAISDRNRVVKIYDPKFRIWNNEEEDYTLEDFNHVVEIPKSRIHWKPETNSIIKIKTERNADGRYQIISNPVFRKFKDDEITNGKAHAKAYEVEISERRGISCSTSAKSIETLEGHLYLIVSIPSDLIIKQSGKNKTHCSLLPDDNSKSKEEFLIILRKIKWRKVLIV